MESASLLSESLFAFLWALLLSIFAIPTVIFLSFRKKLLDLPNNRTVHEDGTPRLGGLAIFAGFASAITIFGDFSNKQAAFQQIMAGCILLFFVGLKDDIAPITAFKKFFIQVLSAGIVVFLGDVRITHLHGFLDVFLLQNDGLSYAFTFMMIIAITNSINLIDGLNGLAGSIVVVVSVCFGFLFFNMNSTLTVMSFALTGAFIGFLRYNMFSGKIFMGDSGSLVGGFVISILCIQFLESDVADVSLPVAHVCISIMIIPLFDTLRVFVLRSIQGKSPFTPDKNHVHHKLLSYGCSQLVTVLILLFVNIALVVFALYFGEDIDLNIYVAGLAVFAIGVSFIFKFLDKKYDVV